MLHIVWYKRDLRVHDHRPLAAAAGRGTTLPLYIVEPELWRQPDASARQWTFVTESLRSLRDSLQGLGAPLVVRTGRVVDVLDHLRLLQPSMALWSHQETGNDWTFRRDEQVRHWCRRHGVAWHELRQHGVERGRRGRDGWARRRDRCMAEPLTPPPAAIRGPQGIDPGRIPSANDLGLDAGACPGRQTGGRAAALATLESFLSDRGRYYRTEMSSPLTAPRACSRLSPHLAWGTMSMREVAQATRHRSERFRAFPDTGSKAWRDSLRSFDGRLHWHCHFMQKLESEPQLEFRNMHPAYDGLRPVRDDHGRLEAWTAGETGYPFVDACMRSLRHDGWINFRMRAMLMAFASYHLWLDWRRPGEHLARQFTDYEPGIHWSQVQMQSGTTGINTPRIYNPVKQGYDQDPDGTFVRRWLPELADVPGEFIHEPWRWDGAATVLDRRYPSPIVDHLAAARTARQKVWAVRRGADYRRKARAIQDLHGSRRRQTGGGRQIDRSRILDNPQDES